MSRQQAALAVLAVLNGLALPFWRTPDADPPTRRRLAVAVIALSGAGLAGAWLLADAAGPSTPLLHGLARFAAVLTAVVTGGPVATAMLRLADPGDPHRPGPADPAVLHGGAWVGALERLAVASALLAGWPEGIAITLAIKGLARYPELREPAAAERFIIGTFTSLLWACGCAAVGAALPG